MIEGVSIRQLRRIPDERGWLMEILRNDSPEYTQFGQVYATATYDGTVKGMHLHMIQTDNIACVVGMIKLVLFKPQYELDHTKCYAFPTDLFEEYFIGELNPCLVQVPPGVYHGWKAYGGSSVVVNVPTHPYRYDSPDEYRIDPHSLGYNWNRIDR